jgi:F-type H+-transporting ATPase subunit delta
MKTGKMTTIARPYALAAFEYASAHNAIPEWEAALSAGAVLSDDESVQQLLMNPKVTLKQIGDLYTDVLGKMLNAEVTNFFHLLTQNHRLSALPEIAELFKAYRAAQEKTLNVTVTSAVVLDDSYKQKLSEALTKRLKRQVLLKCNLDAKLLGGAVISAGDMVIDGSVRGKLNRMIEFISGISLR